MQTSQGQMLSYLEKGENTRAWRPEGSMEEKATWWRVSRDKSHRFGEPLSNGSHCSGNILTDRSTEFLRRTVFHVGALEDGSSGAVVVKTPESSVYPGIPSIRSEILLSTNFSDCQYCYCHLGNNSCLLKQEEGGWGTGWGEGRAASQCGGCSWRAALSTQLTGAVMGEVLSPGLGSALDGCMTLSKSFRLVLSCPPDSTCLLYADGSHTYILILNLPTELELLS